MGGVGRVGCGGWGVVGGVSVGWCGMKSGDRCWSVGVGWGG